jgi:hypothetical protein
MKTGEVTKALGEGKKLTDGRYVYKINIYDNLARCLKGSNSWEKIQFEDLNGLNLSIYERGEVDETITIRKSQVVAAWNDAVANMGDMDEASEEISFSDFYGQLKHASDNNGAI